MRRVTWFTLAALAVCAPAHADESSTSRHLLTGVRAFRDARYEEALVELSIVARAPDAPADLAFYLGPTLYKLGRYREALGVFVTSRAKPDALTDFYVGQTCYQLRLYRKARAVFAGLKSRGLGPVLDEAAGRYVAAVDASFMTAPTRAAIDYYVVRGLELATEPAIAAEYLDEARRLEALAPTRHRRDEIAAALGAAWNASGRPAAVIAALGTDAFGAGARWQLARAYVAVGDGGHARPLLESLVRDTGPYSTDAAALLAKLP